MRKLFLIFNLALLMGFAETPPEKHEIKNTIGTYPLYWDNVYVININNSYGTLIEPPAGYKIKDVALGDSKYYSSEWVNNRARIKRLAPDNAKSNVHIIMQGPDGVSRSLTVELTGKSSPKVSTVKFMIPTNRELDAQLEQIKSNYTTQMNDKLSHQERELTVNVQKKTMKEVETFRFNSYPSGTSAKELGAKVYLNSILNSNGHGYVYLSTNAEDPDCQVVQLKSINGKNVAKQVNLLSTEVKNGMTHYVYETSPFLKSKKKQKLKFKIKVYQEETLITAKVL